MNALAEIRASLRQSRGLAVAFWFHVALTVGALAAMPFDTRRILGLNPWIKPLKFDLSTLIFLLTIALMLHALGRREAGEQTAWPRSRAWLGWGFGVCMIVENAIISLQSARGVRSHMNYSTVKDALLFAVMGLFIALNTVLAGWLLALWFWTKTDLAPAIVWGVRLGLLMLLAASAEGVRIVMNQAHTVGAKDGGPGLAFLNWSTLHGDLRVAHFFALHGLQLLPLAGIALAKTRLSSGLQIALLFVFAGVYGGGVWWLFAEAMRGAPLLH
jgi:hypothetical protein